MESAAIFMAFSIVTLTLLFQIITKFSFDVPFELASIGVEGIYDTDRSDMFHLNFELKMVSV